MEITNDSYQDIPLWQLTVSEFKAIINNTVESKMAELVKQTAAKSAEKDTVYGLDGIMQIFGCSKTKACQIKNSGIIDDAMVVAGRKIIVDANKALACYKNHQEKQTKKYTRR